jgi:hypothetical protein
MKILHELGLKYGTDKAHVHQFTHIYDNIFYNLKNEKLKFLEIGVWLGSSLKMWEQYFINSEIYGCDIMTEEERKNNQQTAENGICKDIKFDEQRTKIFVTNQEQEEDLIKLPNNLDIIIDDGGHTMLQQQKTLKIMFKKLKSGGFYILEDLHTSYWKSYGANEKNNTLKLLNDFNNKKISNNNEYFIDTNDFQDILNELKGVEIIQTKPESITSVLRKL